MNAFVLDRDYQIIGMVDNYESFIWTDRYCDCGDFELHVSANRETFRVYKPDNYIWMSDSDRLQIIEEVELTTSDTDRGGMLTITGRTLESLLDRRIIWNQVVFTDKPLEEVIETLLNDNAIRPSDQNRKIPGLVYQKTSFPELSTVKINETYLGENLFTVIQSLCEQHDVGFKMIRDEQSGSITFSLYLGSVKEHVVFSEKYENLFSVTYLSSKKNVKTAIRIGGEENDTTKRRFMTETGGGAGLNRKEEYLDASSESQTIRGENSDQDTVLTDEQYRNVLIQKGKEELEKYKISILYDAEIDPYRQFAYEKDYTIGDKVTVVNPYGIEDVCRVTEVVRSHDVEGYTIIPTFTSKTTTSD